MLFIILLIFFVYLVLNNDQNINDYYDFEKGN